MKVTFLYLEILFIVHQKSTDSQSCTWPSEIQGTWTDSLKGDMVFSGSTMNGWSFTMQPNEDGGSYQVRDTWQCVSTEMFESDGYLVMKTTDRIHQLDEEYTAYRCLHMTQITNNSYRYYQIEPTQVRVQFERLNIMLNDAETNATVLCNHDNGASGSEFQLMISTGNEADARVRCPYNFVNHYDYTYTAMDGTVSCDSSIDDWDMCSNNSEVAFDYGTCPTKVANSVSDTVWCMDNLHIGGAMFVMLYNALDTGAEIDGVETFRFSCMSLSAENTQISITPQHCKASQTPDTVPVDNSGASVGATLTLASTGTHCPPCPVPANPLQGSVSVATSGATITATYTCDADKTMYGSPTRECLTDGSWYPSAPTCTCEPPVTPSNGTVTIATDGTITASYRCDNGYVLSGNSIRTCITTTNLWTGSNPTCRKCQELPTLANGVIDMTSTGTTSLAAYTCSVQFTLNGVPLRTCQTDTTWDSNTPMCTSCQTLTVPSSGNIDYDTSGTTTTATVTCMDNYTLMGVNLLACRADGSWDSTVPDCVCNPPTSPANGSVVISTDRTTATYTCDLYTTLDNPDIRTCLGGGAGWDGADPNCVECTFKSDPVGGTVIVTTDGVMTSAVYLCDLRFSMDGHLTSQCQADGTWAAVDTICNECDPLTPPEGGAVQFDTNGITTYVSYTCAAGTTLNGNSSLICQSDGSWSVNPAAILCVECESLALISGGSHSITTTGTQSMVTFSCSTGYQLNGHATAICGSDGKWDVTEPTCVATETEESGSNPLFGAVIALTVVSALLLIIVVVSFFIIANMKKKINETMRMNKMIQEYNKYYGDPEMKQIPIAAVPPQHAPRSHTRQAGDTSLPYSRSSTFHTSPSSTERSSTTFGALSPTKSAHFSRPIHSARSISSLGKVKFDLVKDHTTTSIILNNPAPWNKKKRKASKLPRLDPRETKKESTE